MTQQTSFSSNHEKLSIDTIITYTGKLNTVEKKKVMAGIESGKSLGSILNDITLFRDKIQMDNLLQDNQAGLVKNPVKSKVKLDMKKDSQDNKPLNPWEQKENIKNQVRSKTDDLINLPKPHKGKKK